MGQRKQTLLDTNPKNAQPVAKMAQSTMRKYWLYVMTAIVLGLIAAAEVVWWLSSH